MKKTLLLTLFSLALGLPAIAQPPGGPCTPDRNICQPPSLDFNGPPPVCFVPEDNLPPATPGQAGYEGTLKFVFTQSHAIEAVRVDSVTGLGGTLDVWAVSGNSNDPQFGSADLPETMNPDNNQVFGCFTVFGDIPPGFSDGDTVVVTAFITAELSIGERGGEAEIEIPISNVTSRRPKAVAQNSFRVSPNPMTPGSQVEFELTERTDLSLRVVDMNGRVVHEAPRRTYGPNFHRVDLPYDRLSSGLYMVQLQSGNQFLSTKLLKP